MAERRSNHKRNGKAIIGSSSEYENEVELVEFPPMPEDEEAKEEFELPPGAKLLTDCEASDVLLRMKKELDSLEEPNIKIPIAFSSTLEHTTKVVVQYTDVKSIKQALESLKGICTDWEICMIANTCPGTCEEAYALIPSLKKKEEWIEEPLIDVLSTLAKFRVKD
ncbi:DNA-directed RNA polymerases IV and V subunit 4-like [Phalaenopsis equestris]|uniref:DNA-directed RNA polymerases IV and V subunit 4-like n=1 Tax=Phalaenopsis equestris TaxID=78828 RepID=UPI0009E3026C|nr:DNA-directed RNA polymerases IV and V subunit 4-like [Phalaenopsis equestris]